MNNTLYSPELERLVRLEDSKSGLSGYIAIHSSVAGPAAGGCRFLSYACDEDARRDAARLAEGMSYKNVMAGLPLGGGKAVIRLPDRPFDREQLFRAFGQAVERLGGAYVTAEDVGTSVEDMDVVAKTTRHVAGLSPRNGKPGGDPSLWTALGVKTAMESAAQLRFGKNLSELTVAVQGLGHVGFELCRLLYEAGAKLIVAEPRADLAARAAVAFDAQIANCRSILDAKADIFAPCALGGVLTRDTALHMRARLVCGAANNQLASPEVGTLLAERGILYAPDYVVNAGGIVNVAAEYLGWSTQDVRDKVETTGERLLDVLHLAEKAAIPTNRAADSLAREALLTARSAPHTELAVTA
ncbi:Glu/Leu/Phe/Val dehydrogenase [Altericroceibacterium spongiae]|uniref:Glu/Leu/Phe/Val dehydrogenase n=1 Tax=Altericroceibacterium spongiae TaxID=2320269 RepID=A0A420EF70_9SPHN|nr:Glu/Leu/Phe/Val dehydrogenase dimerization domain-containing protein [Altericroceibacterium spongiae]RKF19332.1 Glu/Leu/Phe/Val dehydrogenase [Altericroceibacterium spongiae]